jgi:hypothetical protein
MNSETVVSATKVNLITGIIFSILILVLEGACVSLFYTDSLINAICITLILQIVAGILGFIAYINLDMYQHRKRFNIFYVTLDNDTNIEKLKNDFYICNVTENGIIYVDKNDRDAVIDFNFNNNNMTYESFTAWCNKRKNIK